MDSLADKIGGWSSSRPPTRRRLVITLTAIIDPRWWHRTAIPPTGWPRPAVEAVLLLTLASGLVAIGLGFAQAG